MIKMKRQGDSSVVSGVYTLLLALLVLYVVFLALHSYVSTANSSNDIKMTIRTYLLKMELNGCLSVEDTEALVAELRAYGLTEIQLSGNFDETITNPAIKQNEGVAAVGTQVFLHVEGTLSTEAIRSDSALLSFQVYPEKKAIDIMKKGVSVK